MAFGAAGHAEGGQKVPVAGGSGGFWQEYIAAVVLAVVLGAAGAAGVAGVMDGAFGKVMGDVLGPADEYTLIVHVRAEAEDAAADQIESVLQSLEAELPGAGSGSFGLRRGVSVAGNANFFISVPEPAVQSALLERLPEALRQLPGFNGYTWLLEPSVTVAARDGAVRDEAAQWAAEMEGVRAVVRHGTRLTVVARDEAARADIARRLEAWLADLRVVDLDWPESAGPRSGGFEEALQDELTRLGWRMLPPDGVDAATEVYAGPLAALEKLPEAWARFTGAGADTEAALRQLIAAVDALEPFVAAAARPETQAVRLSEALREGEGAEAVKDVLFRLAASALWQALTGEAEGKAAAKGVGPGAETEPDLLDRWLHVRTLLEQAAEGAGRAADVSKGDLAALGEAVEALERLLPRRADDTGWTILADKSVTAAAVEEAVLRAAGTDEAPGVRAFVAGPGVVEPNPRAVLAALLRDVRRAVAGVLALLAAFAVLLLDHAAVFAAWARLPSAGSRARWRAPAVGGLLFVGTYFLAGGGMPGAPWDGPWGLRGLELAVVAACGALAGIGAWKLAPRISPVDEAELLAGMSLGLDDGQILREIVVPRGRPGVLTFLNEFRREFP